MLFAQAPLRIYFGAHVLMCSVHPVYMCDLAQAHMRQQASEAEWLGDCAPVHHSATKYDLAIAGAHVHR